MTKLDGIKPGDRVRVTFEGRMEEARVVIVDGRACGMYLNDSELRRDTFRIERLDPPLKVGDRVTWEGNDWGPSILIAIDDQVAWVRRDESRFNCSLADLRPVP